jgi:hypothetical protein
MGKNVWALPTGLSKLPARVSLHAALPAAGEAGFMFFLLRMTFWLGLVLVLLPIGAAQRSSSTNEVSASEAISAASATVGDLRGFCARQPDACVVGSEVATAIGERAQAGAKMLYTALSEAMAPRATGSLANATVQKTANSKTAPTKSATERTSQSTLTATDLAPAWRGPVAHKDGKHPA